MFKYPTGSWDRRYRFPIRFRARYICACATIRMWSIRLTWQQTRYRNLPMKSHDQRLANRRPPEAMAQAPIRLRTFLRSAATLQIDFDVSACPRINDKALSRLGYSPTVTPLRRLRHRVSHFRGALPHPRVGPTRIRTWSYPDCSLCAAHDHADELAYITRHGVAYRMGVVESVACEFHLKLSRDPSYSRLPLRSFWIVQTRWSRLEKSAAPLRACQHSEFLTC